MKNKVIGRAAVAEFIRSGACYYRKHVDANFHVPVRYGVKNLGAVLAYSAHNIIEKISVADLKDDGTARLIVRFKDRTYYAKFASSEVLISHFLSNRRGWYGVPVEVVKDFEVVKAGKLSKLGII